MTRQDRTPRETEREDSTHSAQPRTPWTIKDEGDDTTQVLVARNEPAD